MTKYTFMAILFAFSLTGCALATVDSHSTLTEQLSYEVPASFKPYRSTSHINESIERFALTKENETRWEQILTVHTFHNTTSLDPKAYVLGMVDRMRDTCSGADIAPLLGEGQEVDYDSFEANIFCYRNRKNQRGEVYIVKAVSGRKNGYVITRAFRTDPFNQDKISQLVPWLKKFEPTVRNATVVMK